MSQYLNFNTDKEIAFSMAKWIAEQRLLQNRSQQDICEATGISESTYRRFEQTGAISLERLISILRALNQLDKLEQLINSSDPISPMDKLTGTVPVKKRLRARKTQKQQSNKPKTSE